MDQAGLPANGGYRPFWYGHPGLGNFFHGRSTCWAGDTKPSGPVNECPRSVVEEAPSLPSGWSLGHKLRRSQKTQVRSPVGSQEPNLSPRWSPVKVTPGVEN